MSAGQPHPSSGDAGRPKGPRLFKAAVLLGFLAVAMMGLSLVLPWYNVSISLGGSSEYSYHENRDYSLHGRELALREKYASHDEMVLRQSDSWKEGFGPGLPDLYLNVQILIILGLISASLLVAGAVFLPANKARYLLPVLCILAIIAGVAAPLYHQSENPGAMWGDRGSIDYANGPDMSFSGYAGHEGPTRTWGPAAGWYLSFFGAMFAAGAMALLRRHERAGGTGWMSRSAMLCVVTVVVLIVGTSLSFHLLAVEQQGTERVVDEYYGGEGGDPTTYPVLTVTKAKDGDWVLTSKGGSRFAAYVYLQIRDVNTGGSLLDARLTSGTETNPDFLYLDGNQNGVLDFGDSIILHATRGGQPNPHVVEGSKVQLLKGGSCICTAMLR